MNEQNAAVWERRVAESLEALAESEVPTATVTVEDIVAAGRRARLRHRSRRAFALTAALVAATALTLGALAVARNGDDPAPPAGQSPSPGSSASAGTGSDPAVADLSFGWLPTSLDGTNEIEQFAPGTDFKASVNSHTYLPPDDGPGGSFLQAWGSGAVSLTAGIEAPGSGIGSDLTLSPAGTVEGHEAWWADGTPGSTQATSGGALMLYWQYEPNAWATVTYHGTPDAAAGTMMLHVASALVIGPTKPYALPFHLQSLPAGMHAFSFNLNLPHLQGSQFGDGALILCVKSPCNAIGAAGGLLVSQQPTTWLGGETVDINDAPMLMPGTNTPIQEGSTTTPSHKSVTVDGHAATLWTNATGATLTFTYDGTSVVVSAADAEYAALGGETGFLDFCRSLTWLGPNPAHWTTNVIG